MPSQGADEEIPPRELVSNAASTHQIFKQNRVLLSDQRQFLTNPHNIQQHKPPFNRPQRFQINQQNFYNTLDTSKHQRNCFPAYSQKFQYRPTQNHQLFYPVVQTPTNSKPLSYDQYKTISNSHLTNYNSLLEKNKQLLNDRYTERHLSNSSELLDSSFSAPDVITNLSTVRNNPSNNDSAVFNKKKILENNTKIDMRNGKLYKNSAEAYKKAWSTDKNNNDKLSSRITEENFVSYSSLEYQNSELTPIKDSYV